MKTDNPKSEKPFQNVANKIDVSQKVLEQIKSRKVKITERWVWWSKKLGLGSGLIFTALILIILTNLILYWAQSHGLISHLGLGWPALTFILKKLPFIYFAIALVVFIIINFIINKTGLIYKKYYRLIIILIWLLIIGSGFFLFYTDLNSYFEKQVALSEKKIFLLSKIYGGNIPCLPNDKNGVIGKIIELNNDNLTLQTLDNQKTINVVGQRQLFTFLNKGQLIIAIGTGSETLLVADKIKEVTPEMIDYCFNQY